MIRLVTILGPTATGKSRLALRLAQQFNGEIVSADSRQVYRRMDISTAKPRRQDMVLVPHHLIDIINSDEDFSLAQYQKLAFKSIEDIRKRNKLPFLVGGSGLYIWAVLEGWQIPQIAPDPEFRRRLENRAARGEAEELYQELQEIDPVAAQRIDRKNTRRIIRALEVTTHADTPISRLQGKKPPPFNTLIIGLTTDRKELYNRIDLRVDGMVKQGLLEEVNKLVDLGYDFSLPAMSGIGYRQTGMFLRSEMDMESAIQQIKTETHRFVRRQYNWFKLSDDRIQWFDIKNDSTDQEITALVSEFLEG
ncbi:tRNA (adenosine(37)-N6)-dimethylallyltransferase MiaA [Chloroflexota bacterium]